MSLLQTFDADPRQSLEVGNGPIDHFNSLDRPLPSPEVQRPCSIALPDDVADRNVVRRAVGVDDPQVEHLHVGAAHVQADGPEASLAAADVYGVAIPAEE